MKKNNCMSEKDCQGTMIRKHIDYPLKKRGKKIIASDIDVWECNQCGERIFSHESMERLEAH